MNSVQKKYFENRVNAVKRTHERQLQKLYDDKEEKPLSFEERFNAIFSGSALSRLDEALAEFERSGTDCSRQVKAFLENAYRYPEEDARKSRNAELSKFKEKALKAVYKLSEDILDQVILGAKTPEEAIEEFKTLDLESFFK